MSCNPGISRSLTKGNFTRKAALLASSFGLLLSFLVAGQFWEDKPYTKWSKKQCQKILDKSPWSHRYSLGSAVVNPRENIGSVTPHRGGWIETGEDVYLQMRFVTAKPVKAAIGRLRLLSDPGNKALSKDVEQYVNQPDSSQIVVEITYGSKTPGALSEIDAYFRSQTLETVKHQIYLSDTSRESRVEISQYVPPGQGRSSTLLFFPRYYEGEVPHFDGSEKKIVLHLNDSIDVFLKPQDMIFQGEFTL